MKKIITRIRNSGLLIESPIFDGTVHHYGNSKKVWLVGITHTIDNITYYRAHFGDVRTSAKYFEEDWSESPTPEIEKEMKRVISELEKEKQLERQAKWEEMAAFAEYTWAQCPLTFKPTAYSLRKGIHHAYGARNLAESGIGSTIIAVAMQDIDGNIRNIQRILPQKDSSGNDKPVLEGAQIDGLFTVVMEGAACAFNEAAHVVFSEGYATAATVSAILKLADAERVLSISCANAGNLRKVAEVFRARFPNLLFTVAADNDYQKTNTGVEAAVNVARYFGAKIVVPPAEDGITDWNDYMLKYGLEQANNMFYSPQGELVDVATPSTNKDKKKKLNDHQVASIVIQSFGNNLHREAIDDYFMWEGTHWVHRDPKVFPLQIQQRLSQVAGSGRTSDMKAAWAHFHAFFPVRPQKLFDVVKWKANFTNGTLSVNPETKKVFFHEHRREDFMTTTIPFELPFPRGEITQEMCMEEFEKYPKNTLFFQYIDHVFGLDKMQDILQGYAAAIIPSFSRIIMAIGNPGSGKSTMAKILIAFLDEKNISGVQPCNFKEFHLHGMVGKVANIVPELNLTLPIVDDIVKSLIDQERIPVNRKGIDFIHAILSPLQIWCGNDHPKSRDGTSGAYERRMGIIRTKPTVKNIPQDDFFVIRLIRESGTQILLGALKEFFTLLQQGGFKQTEDSLKEVKAFQMGSDTTGQFISDIREGLFNSTCNEFKAQNNGTGQFQCQTLYTVYKEWSKENGKYQLSSHEFRKQMDRSGFKASKKRILGTGRNENPKWVYEISVEQAVGSPV